MNLTLKQAKAGKKLSPQLAAVSAPIYARNPVRYKRLILWIWHCQRMGWPDEAIAGALKLCDRNMDTVDNWWSYLTFLLPKAKAQAVEAQSMVHKSEVAQIVDDFKEFMEWKAAKQSKG